MKVLTQLLTHPVSVERLSDEGRFGRTYEDPEPLLCFVHGKQRLVRTSEGDEVVSRKTLYLHPAAIPEQSRVTLDGDTWTVVATAVHELPGPNPVLLELALA